MNFTKKPGVGFGFVVRSDLGRIAELEALCYRAPWDENALLHHVRAHPVGITVHHGAVLVGYALYQLRPRSIGICRLGVHPACWRRGFGSALVAKLVSKLAPGRRTSATIVVRETNLQGQLFLRGRGFRAVKLVREAYADTGEDAIAMMYQHSGLSTQDSALRTQGQGGRE